MGARAVAGAVLMIVGIAPVPSGSAPALSSPPDVVVAVESASNEIAPENPGDVGADAPEIAAPLREVPYRFDCDVWRSVTGADGSVTTTREHRHAEGVVGDEPATMEAEDYASTDPGADHVWSECVYEIGSGAPVLEGGLPWNGKPVPGAVVVSMTGHGHAGRREPDGGPMEVGGMAFRLMLMPPAGTVRWTLTMGREGPARMDGERWFGGCWGIAAARSGLARPEPAAWCEHRAWDDAHAAAYGSRPIRPDSSHHPGTVESIGATLVDSPETRALARGLDEALERLDAPSPTARQALPREHVERVLQVRNLLGAGEGN